MVDMDIRMLGTTEVCKLLHIGKKKCLELFHSADFPSVKFGRKFLIKEDCLDKYLSEKRMLSK